MPINKPFEDSILYPTQIAELESSARLGQFFGTLGYDTTAAADLAPTQLGLTENLQQQVRSSRLIATGRDADSEIQIVLLEMRSLALMHTQAIAQCLRQKPNNYLLILTVDYSIFDFALLERVRAEGQGTTHTPRYIIRPRLLTIHRNDPGAVGLRVLKRFTYTETDDLAQWDKLRSAYTLAEWSEPDFNNRALFSDYYLKHRLTDPDFHSIWKDDVRPIGGKVKALIAGARSKFAGKPEALTRSALMEPLWKEMGFSYTFDGSHSYTLTEPGNPDKALAVALTYKWGRNLDSSDPERDSEYPAEIPGALVVSLLEKAAAPWVILTNGKVWRLYSATAANKITNYYEVDLEEAIYASERDPVAAFKYWWLIFRRAAFSDGLLEKIVTESQAYARQIGKRLKDRIFEEIFGYFAGGFVAHMREQQRTAIDLDVAYQATMTFLYRLMFILYAESRELLPIKQESGYAPHSLKTLKEEIAHHAGTLENATRLKLDATYDPHSTALYSRIQTLYIAIDKGDPALNLPVYNGGLFSSETPEGAFLDQHAIPDLYLAIGLDRLARDIDTKSGALAFIDYKSLGVRELGSIYEGLLEFKLRIAAEDLAIVRDGKREIYLTRAQAKKEKRAVIGTVDKDMVYIENTKQERKATGSYYTPDYIVNYIVEHTVGPVLEEKFAALRARLHQTQKRYRQHSAEVKGRKDTQSPELFWTSDNEAIQLADDCLNIRVLDPAMGSGHFLVAAVDYISNRLIDFLNAWTENPVWALLERTRTDILADLQGRGINVDESKLTRVVLLKRSVLKRCVYGVDLNRMAVELAKVSLWLDAFTLGAPLSFLDHHLKHGNSLIGARVDEVRDAVEGKQGQKIQTTFFTGSAFEGLKRAVETMREISYLPDNTITQAQQSKKSFGSANDLLAPLKRALNVYTSRWFGNAPIKKGRNADVFDPTIEFLRRKDTVAWLHNTTATLPKTDYMDAPLVAQIAQTVTEDKAFFHWELEFPEVFFAATTHGGQDVQIDPNGGFDAVVGNPPWVDVQEIDQTIKPYFSVKFLAAQGKYDLYGLFVEHSIELIKPTNGFSTLIFQSKFLVTDYGRGLRKSLATKATIESILVTGISNVFADITTYPIVLTLSKHDETRAAEPLRIISIPARNSASDYERVLIDHHYAKQFAFSVSHEVVQTEEPWVLELDSVTQLMKRFDQFSVPFGSLVNSISYGVKTNLDEAYLAPLTEWKKKGIETSLLLPAVKARDLDRFSIEYDARWMIFPYTFTHGQLTPVDISKYPNAKKHFESMKPKLLKRLFFGKTILEQGMQYFELPYTSSHSQRPKLIFPNVTSRTLFSVDPGGRTIFVAPSYVVDLKPDVNILFLAAVLNTRLMDVILKRRSTSLANGYTEMMKQYVEDFPIYKIDFTTPAPHRNKLAAEARSLATQSDPAPVLTFTAARLSAGETDVIHDLLASLAEQMIDLNKRKQAEMKRFLGWLDNQLQIRPDKDGETGIDSLKKKSFIQNYLGDYQKGASALTFDDPANKNTLWYCLWENRTRFGASLTAIKVAIRDEYEKSLAVLLPIKSELSRTDALIDRVVYQLYGLTDEEIRLIEYPGLAEAAGSARTEVLREPDIATQPDPVLADKIVEKIEPAAEQYFARVDESGIEAQLRAEITGWNTLPTNVQKFLRTGETLLVRNNIEDYSGVMIYYAKAVEALLIARWFEPFRATHSESDVANEIAFKPYMRGEKPLTLGNIPFLLSGREIAFRAFLGHAYPADRYSAIIDGRTGFGSVLTTETINRFRNGSAHIEDQAESDAKDARAWALRVIGYV